LASSDQRDNERVPTFLRVRLRFADVDTFIEKYSTNVSLGGVFIQSRSPKPPGTILRFELALESGESLIKGEGQVTWVREFDANAPGQPFGMGVRFTNLDAKSRALVDRAVAHRQSRAGSTEATPSTFTPAVPRTRAPREPAASLASSPSARHADAELDALMREAGLDQEKVARAAARATAAVGQEPASGELGALLKAGQSRPGAPVTPPPRPAGTPPPTPPPRTQAARPAAPARPPTPAPAVRPPSRPRTPPPAEAAARAARKGARAGRRTPRPVDADADVVFDAEPASILLPTAEPLAPSPRPAARTNESVLPAADIDELLGGLSETAIPSGARADPGGLVGADLEIESLGGSQATSSADRDAVPAYAPPEITAVGTPPRFEETAEDEPLVFPDRDVSTPPPEPAGSFLAADSTLTPSDPGRIDEQPPEAGETPARAPQSAADRWAAASGPETANLDAELIAALDSVIDHTPIDDAPVASANAPTQAAATAPPPAAHADTGKRGDDKGDKGKKSKGILGRLFRKKG